jgi:hypothetical protein
VRRAPATASGSNVTSSRPPRSTSPVRATRAGRALFPLPKNIGALSDPRTALVVRSGREVKRDVFMRELNLLLGTSMAPDDLSVALEFFGAVVRRQQAHPNLRHGSHKSLVALYAALHGVHRNTARARLRRTLGLSAPRGS